MSDGETSGQHSDLTTVLAHVRDGSTAVALARRLGRGGVRVARNLAVAYRESHLGMLEGWVGRTSRASVTGRWLSGDRSSAILVDLESTWTLGPVLALVDRLAGLAIVHRSVRGLGRVSRPIRRAPVRLACVAVIGFAVAALGFSWSSATPVAQVSWIVLATLGLLGLRIDASWRELAAGSVDTVLRRVFEPPALDELPDGDG